MRLPLLVLAFGLGLLTPIRLGAGENATAESASKALFSDVPRVVIDHSPQSSGLYIGSPSIAVLTNGHYVASHDFFGPRSNEHQKARTLVFR